MTLFNTLIYSSHRVKNSRRLHMTKTITKPVKSEKSVKKAVAKKASKPVAKASAKKNPKAIGISNLVRNRPLSKKQIKLFNFIKETKGHFTLQQAGDVLGHKKTAYGAIYAFSAIKALINRGLVIKGGEARKPAYKAVGNV